ncbi:MAG: hypothetical protein OIF35_03265 [Cellvibrionaceae bacterium]|nr:hypothetical protein [Cellvibrionaceae bacterium]MCV6627734.1 hypothetical protein [Cellvibrionaceae bacterium]
MSKLAKNLCQSNRAKGILLVAMASGAVVAEPMVTGTPVSNAWLLAVMGLLTLSIGIIFRDS